MYKLHVIRYTNIVGVIISISMGVVVTISCIDEVGVVNICTFGVGYEQVRGKLM